MTDHTPMQTRDETMDAPILPEIDEEPVRQRPARPSKLEKSSARIGLAILVFVMMYATIFVRLGWFAVAPVDDDKSRSTAQDEIAAARPDILDRNGEVLAMDVKVPSLFAEPRNLIDVDEATELLTGAIPDLDPREVRAKIATQKGFVWLKREVSAEQQAAVHALGLPGVGFLTENKRVYPNGPTLSHVLGSVNIDNQGIAGIEKYIDKTGLADLHALGFANKTQDLSPVRLSIDLRAQHVMRDELLAGMERFRAKAAGGVVMDVNTGEMIALVSLPDFDPNNPGDPTAKENEDKINRINVGVFEMGSTFKALTLAMAIDSGRFTTESRLDARAPLRYGRFSISDYHAQRRVLSLPEVFTYSSNIGTARMALALGVDAHKSFLRRMGQLTRLVTELPENAAPIIPPRWGELNTVTISFGHGLSVAPLQAVMAVGAMMNGGYLVPPTFLRHETDAVPADAPRVLTKHTSDVMRYLMRLNAEKGTAGKADVRGYFVGGKTGTAEKVIGGRYSKTKLLTTFMAVFPFDKPKYLILVMYDEPQPTKETYGFATAGWNAAPTTGRIVGRIAPLLGVEPRFQEIVNEVPPLTSARAEPTVRFAVNEQ
jgi:cell division protein FtsI (penicillin-binding protein 3)